LPLSHLEQQKTQNNIKICALFSRVTPLIRNIIGLDAEVTYHLNNCGLYLTSRCKISYETNNTEYSIKTDIEDRQKIMARVTVEDCLEFVDTNYEFLVDEDNDKPIVIALREIAEDVQPEEVLAADMELEAPDEMTLDQDQTQEPIEISIN